MNQLDPRAQGAVLVTGASTGIGNATAHRLQHAGFRVFAGVRKEEDAARISSQGTGALTPIKLDITEADQISAAKQEILSQLGDLPFVGIVNNAGVALTAPLEFIPPEVLRRQLDVNVIGQVALTQAFIPELRKSKGRIVFIGSVGGRIALPLLGPYAASKFALEAVNDSLRRELRKWQIQVAIVEPGGIKTPIWDTSAAAAELLLEDADPAIHELYGTEIAAIRAAAEQMSKNGLAPEEVAESVAHAMTAKKPNTRYLVGRDAKFQVAATKILPTRVFDALVARTLAKAKLR